MRACHRAFGLLWLTGSVAPWACDRPSRGPLAVGPGAAPVTSIAPPVRTASSAAGAPATPSEESVDAAGAPFSIVFAIHSAAGDARSALRGRLRVRTLDGQTFEYRTPVSHRDCYLLASGSSAPARSIVEGDEAHLVCAGGGQTDEATVVRRSSTSVEITIYQKAFTGPDTAPAMPAHTQTFSIRVPSGAKLRIRFDDEPASTASAPEFSVVSATLCQEYGLTGRDCRPDAFEAIPLDLDGDAPSEWIYVLRQNGPESCHLRHACFSILQRRGASWSIVLRSSGNVLRPLPLTRGANRSVAVVSANSACEHVARVFRAGAVRYDPERQLTCSCERPTTPGPCSSTDDVVLQ